MKITIMKNNNLIKKRDIFQFIRFVIVGFINTGVDFGFFNFLLLIFKITEGWPVAVFNSISVGIAMANSYFLNKYWSFQKKETGNRAMEALLFFVFTALGLGINTGIVYSMTTFIDLRFGIGDLAWANISKAVAIAIMLFWNFFWYKFVVFRAHNIKQ